MSGLRLDDAYFERRYAESDDPWGFASRWYERRKYDLTLASLPRRRYARAYEPGCSIGVLTRRLAERCDRLDASELLPDVAARAAERCADLDHVTVSVGALPEAWPDHGQPLDLVVLSEVAYYLTSEGLDEALRRLDERLATDGHVIAVHWLGDTDYPLDGAAVHARLGERPWLRNVFTARDPRFALDVWARA